LADLKNTYIWKKELQRVLEAATSETKKVIKQNCKIHFPITTVNFPSVT
jgi:hypothetical protein